LVGIPNSEFKSGASNEKGQRGKGAEGREGDSLFSSASLAATCKRSTFNVLTF
jgi:hypothetical protein